MFYEQVSFSGPAKQVATDRLHQRQIVDVLVCSSIFQKSSGIAGPTGAGVALATTDSKPNCQNDDGGRPEVRRQAIPMIQAHYFLIELLQYGHFSRLYMVGCS